MFDLFNDGFFGDFFNDTFRDCRNDVEPRRPGGCPAPKPYGLMKTDIKDMGESYELMIDIPGVKKEDVSAELKDGFLVVTASKNDEKDEKGENGKYIRRERFAGKYFRRYFVGKKLKEEDIKASFADGVLKLSVPKENTIEREEPKKLISID